MKCVLIPDCGATNATALGAALAAFVASGIYRNTEEAFRALNTRYEEYLPGRDRDTYEDLYDQYAGEVF